MWKQTESVFSVLTLESFIMLVHAVEEEDLVFIPHFSQPLKSLKMAYNDLPFCSLQQASYKLGVSESFASHLAGLMCFRAAYNHLLSCSPQQTTCEARLREL